MNKCTKIVETGKLIFGVISIIGMTILTYYIQSNNLD